MRVDRDRAIGAFRDYVGAYDLGNPRIALKAAHTYRVAGLCERISGSLGMGEGDVDLAWLLGLLHDIGRFEQVRRFDSFDDASTTSHAALGAEVLFDNDGVIRDFVTSPEEDDLIRTAVATHSSLSLPTGLPDRTRTLCEVLRDADKIDILRVNCTSPVWDIYRVTDEEMDESGLTDEVVATFYRHRCVPHGIRRQPADMLVGHICFVYGLAFPESMAIMREQGYLERMLGRRFTNEETDRAFRRMAVHLSAWMDGGDASA